VVSAVAAMLWARGAPAQNVSKDFTEIYNAGIDAFRLGKYDEARKHLEKARSLEPKLPGPHRFLAAVAQAEGKFEECLHEARIAIKLNPQSSEVGNTQQLHAECRKGLGRPDLKGGFSGGGAIAVLANLEGAAVSLNGLKYGATPLDPRPFPAGEVEVGVEKAGFLAATQKVEILPGIVTDAIFSLEADPKAKVETPVLGNVTPEVTIGWLVVHVATGADAQVIIDGKPAIRDDRGRYEAEPGLREIEVKAPGREPWRRRVLIAKGQSRTVEAAPRAMAELSASRRKGFYALGAAAVFGGVGAVFGLLEVDAREEAQDIWNTETERPTVDLGDSGMLEPVRTRADMDDAVDRGKRWRIVSLAGYGAALVALGVSAYYFVSERPDSPEGRTPPLALVPVLPSGSADSGVGATMTYTRELDW
jgi:PEGA domain-containing protein/tetratricopeptide repeat protein